MILAHFFLSFLLLTVCMWLYYNLPLCYVFNLCECSLSKWKIILCGKICHCFSQNLGVPHSYKNFRAGEDSVGWRQSLTGSPPCRAANRRLSPGAYGSRRSCFQFLLFLEIGHKRFKTFLLIFVSLSIY